MLFGRSCTRSNARASADPRSCDDLQYFPPDFDPRSVLSHRPGFAIPPSPESAMLTGLTPSQQDPAAKDAKGQAASRSTHGSFQHEVQVSGLPPCSRLAS
jgi:hypothetical protein